MLQGKHIILGVTGGIAAYKIPLVVRECVRGGAEVQVVMTPSAGHFVTPLTLATLSRREVVSEMFPPADQPLGQWTRHIDLALWGDVMVIAPATANTIAKIVSGMADNFLTALVLALRGPLVIAPSMDSDMYLNPVTQGNIARLRERGVTIIEPGSGELASGLAGPGRLPEPEAIVAAVDGVLEGAAQDLQGKKIVVTAGPTQEAIDPVRYISNHSSGKMGFALAEAAARRGATVTLIAGPVHLPTPPRVTRHDVVTAREMHEAVLHHFDNADVLIMAAAVADFSPATAAPTKIKRDKADDDRLTIECVMNPDILRAAAGRKQRQIVVGFALETNDEIAHAKEKLAAKRLDLIVMNNPGVEGAGFGSDTNVVTLLSPDGSIDQLPRKPKRDVANAILDRVVRLSSPQHA
jgi:phosphopantothenoylcysteine decarboxylase / phosphopantothenate---cysteine ligase